MIKFNGNTVIFESFPNGESRLLTDNIKDLMFNRISFKYEGDSDLIKLMLLKNHLDDLNINKVNLVIYYMPYSRMDRSENKSPFTLKYISNFINSLNFTDIKVIEPHSDVTNALLNKVEPLYINFDLLPRVLKDVNFDLDVDYLFYPDAGAQKRYSKLKGYKHLVGYKNRDFRTGEIKQLDVIGETPTKGFKAVIVDDLSSYGGTFMFSAEKLNELGASEIYLLVAHAENSIFEGKIFRSNLINKVFTTDTILSRQNWWDNKKYENKLQVYDIEELILYHD